MKRWIQIGAAGAAMLTVLGALWVGMAWMHGALPARITPPEPEPAVSDTSPPMATIPWRRNPDKPARVALTSAWFPWQKLPKNARSVNGGGWAPRLRGRVRVDPARIEAITRQLNDPDRAVQTAGVVAIEALIHEAPLAAGVHLRGMGSPWVKPLLAAKRYGDIESLTNALVIPVSGDTVMLEGVLGVRTRVILLEGRADAAMASCREWFAVSSMPGTASVLAATEQALAIERPVDKGRMKAFRTALAATRPADGTESLRIDAAAPASSGYLEAARGIVEEDYGALVARGNLYLLAGRSDLAESVFRRAYMLANDAQLPAAAENFVRCIKARSGGIFAANARISELAQ